MTPARIIQAWARAVFPLSPRGLCMLLLSAGILAAGVVRADLAALFWGSSFLLFTAYALAAGHLLRITLRRRSAAAADFLSLLLPSAGVSPEEEAEAYLRARLPRAFPPGLSVRLTLPLLWHERRVTPVSLALSPGMNEAHVSFRTERRGSYASQAAVMEIRDILGFTANRLSVPLNESLIVYPAVHAVEELERFMEQADDSAAYVPRRRRSEELLEARKYYPGDDVRRLNWKVFAHLNELFLRVGEEVPPPDSSILFVLDTSANPLVPRRQAADYLDGLVTSCASVMVALLQRRTDVLLSLPGVRSCRSFTEESRPALLAALADAWWTDAAWTPELPGRRRLHVAVFSSPGSPGLAGILTTVRSRGWSASIFLKGPDPAPTSRSWRLRDLLFLPADDRRETAASIRGRERAALEDALARELAGLRAPAAKVMHAAEI